MSKKENKGTPINNFGKFGLIEHITGKAVPGNKSSLSGIGDDSAVVDNSGTLSLISTDLLLEGIHFNLVYTPLRHLGYKAVIRAISDIYAMNGIPGQILVGLGISTRFTVEQVDELYDGIYRACRNYSVDLAGGDRDSQVVGGDRLDRVGLVEDDHVVIRQDRGPFAAQGKV